MSVFISRNITSYDELDSNYDLLEMANKLFCTFSQKPYLNDTIEEILSQYNIMYGKVFVLSSPESEEYMCTYNVELEDRAKPVLSNTILVHRKKESNTLYTVNALNELIMKLNNGVRDNQFVVNWKDYENSILLLQSGEFKILHTQIHTVVKV